jgi:signal transduction histidine kinase
MSPLQALRNSFYLLCHSLDKVEELTKTIDDNVEYAVKNLDDLKVVAAPREMVRTPMDLCDLVEHSLASIAILQSIKVERSYEHPVTILIDSNNIYRVIDNLVKNAVEAMPMGGILTVVVDEKDIMLSLGEIYWIEISQGE